MSLLPVADWRERLVSVARAALPQSCALCAVPSATELICRHCIGTLVRPGAGCPVCALPTLAGDRCGKCLAVPPPFDRSQAAFLYAFPLDRLVQAFKYQSVLGYADWFARSMLDARSAPLDAEVMIPMPLSRNRQRERGFNQALEIARPLSRWTGVRLAPRIVARIRDTPPQASLPWRDRARNIQGAFTVMASAVSGRRVVVIDDVMTTGASLAELARALKSAGALHVENWLVARTPPPSGD